MVEAAESQNLSPSVILPILAVDSVILLLSGRKRPYIPLMMIAALAPFQHDLSVGGPVRFSIAEINLILTCLLFFIRGRRIRFTPSSGPIGLFLGVGLVSSVLSWRPSTLTSMIQMALYFVAAVIVFTAFGRNEEDFRPALYGLLVVGFILAAAVIIRRSGYVLGLHKNGVGASLASAVIVCGELWFAETNPKRRPILSVIMVVLSAGLFFSLSRGAWLGAICGLAVILAMRRQFRLLLRVSCALVPLMAILWHYLPQQSRDYSVGFSEKDNWNIRLRYESVNFARERFHESPVIGVGVGLRKEYDATNVFWLTLAETGVIGLLAFFYFHFAILRMEWKTQKRLPRNSLLYSVVAISGALVTSRMIHGMVDHFWGRGPMMIECASIGMASYAYLEVRRRARMARVQRAHEAMELNLQPT